MLADLTGPLGAPADNPKPSEIMPQQTPPANAGLRILGADVAKETIVFHDSLTGRNWSTGNTAQALSRMLGADHDYDWLVCETTGGYERLLLETAAALGLRACRADAAQVKAFIASHGGRAKTDRIDASWIARYGLERAALLKPWRPPEPRREAFAALLRHRQDLLAQRTQAKNRRGAPGGEPLHDLLDQQIDFLTGQIVQIDDDMAVLLKAEPDLARHEQILRAIPGVGPVVARTLIALLPELGQLGPKQAASLAGLAPHPRDSGTTKRHRTMIGGRAGIRTVLFMAALSAARAHPTLSVFYERLTSAGKPKRLAIAAVARKLVVIANAHLRDHATSPPQLT
jgi:transposase